MSIDVRAKYYSPICDVDRGAYIAYLVVCCIENGTCSDDNFLASWERIYGCSMGSATCGIRGVVNDIGHACVDVGDACGESESCGRGGERESCGDGSIGIGSDASADNGRGVGTGCELKLDSLDGQVPWTSEASSGSVEQVGGIENGVISSVGKKVGPNYERNRCNRENKKKRKQREKNDKLKVIDVEEKERKELAASSSAKWKAENELAAERAVRKLAAMRLISVEDQVKCNRAKLSATTERSLVSIEKTHAKLAASGNVPGNMTGFAATINGSNSISPDSSASNQEFRQCQKALADAEFKLKKVQQMTGVDVDEIVVSPDYEFKDHHLLDIFTENSANNRYISENYGDHLVESASTWGFKGKNRIRSF